MKGWVAEHRERIAAQEREAAMRVDTMRKQHVQNYRKGFGGFCPWCDVVLREGAVHEEGCTKAVRPDGKPRRLLITNWESTTVIVTVKEQKYETSLAGWARRTVRNETYWTKTVAPGVIALLHHIEAMQAGVVQEKATDTTLAIPSITTTGYVAPTPKLPPVARPSPKRSNVVNLNEWNISTQLEREAQRLSAPSASRADQLRRQHVLKYAK